MPLSRIKAKVKEWIDEFLVLNQALNLELLFVEYSGGPSPYVFLKFKDKENLRSIDAGWKFKKFLDSKAIVCEGPSSSKLRIQGGMTTQEQNHKSAINTFRHWLHTLREEDDIPKAVLWDVYNAGIAGGPGPAIAVPKPGRDVDPDDLVDLVDGDNREPRWCVTFWGIKIVSWDSELVMSWEPNDQTSQAMAPRFKNFEAEAFKAKWTAWTESRQTRR